MRISTWESQKRAKIMYKKKSKQRIVSKRFIIAMYYSRIDFVELHIIILHLIECWCLHQSFPILWWEYSNTSVFSTLHECKSGRRRKKFKTCEEPFIWLSKMHGNAYCGHFLIQSRSFALLLIKEEKKKIDLLQANKNIFDSLTFRFAISYSRASLKEQQTEPNDNNDYEKKMLKKYYSDRSINFSFWFASGHDSATQDITFLTEFRLQISWHFSRSIVHSYGMIRFTLAMSITIVRKIGYNWSKVKSIDSFLCFQIKKIKTKGYYWKSKGVMEFEKIYTKNAN